MRRVASAPGQSADAAAATRRGPLRNAASGKSESAWSSDEHALRNRPFALALAARVAPPFPEDEAAHPAACHRSRLHRGHRAPRRLAPRSRAHRPPRVPRPLQREEPPVLAAVLSAHAHRRHLRFHALLLLAGNRRTGARRWPVRIRAALV